MDVALITVGDELLAGETENTNATWLAGRLSERGATVARVLVVPDDRAVIAEYVGRWSERFDAVIVTGGLGGTHDDVTMDAVGDALDRELVLDDAAVESVVRSVAAYRGVDPDGLGRDDLDIDVADWASVPEGSRLLLNDPGLCPGCVADDVYVFPGVPEEVRAMFESVAAEFDGDVVSETLETDAPEGALTGAVEELRRSFDVRVGSYPDVDGPNRIRVSGTDREEVGSAAEWLRERI